MYDAKIGCPGLDGSPFARQMRKEKGQAPKAKQNGMYPLRTSEDEKLGHSMTLLPTKLSTLR